MKVKTGSDKYILTSSYVLYWAYVLIINYLRVVKKNLCLLSTTILRIKQQKSM